jgi:hypothetical protein
MCRLNAVMASAPLLIPATRLFFGERVNRWRWAAAAVAAMAAAVLLPKLSDRLLFQARDAGVLQAVLAEDLAAIYSERPEAFAGSMFEGETTPDELKKLSNQDINVPLFVGAPGVRNLSLDSLPPRKSQLTREWLRVVAKYPDLYAKWRLRRFSRLLGIGPYIHYPLQAGTYPNNYGLWPPGTYPPFIWLRAAQDATMQSLMFRGWLWIGLLCAAGVLGWMTRRRSSLPLWVCVSALAYTGAYLVFAPAADFRYHYWPLLALFASLALLPRRSESAT